MYFSFPRTSGDSTESFLSTFTFPSTTMTFIRPLINHRLCFSTLTFAGNKSTGGSKLVETTAIRPMNPTTRTPTTTTRRPRMAPSTPRSTSPSASPPTTTTTSLSVPALTTIAGNGPPSSSREAAVTVARTSSSRGRTTTTSASPSEMM